MNDASFWRFSLEAVIPRLWEGMQVTLQLTFAAGALGLVFGLLVSFGRMSRRAPLRWLATAYVMLFRGTPLLLQILFIYFALPPLADIRLDAMPAGILALSLNAGAYLAEIYRAGIQSIDVGQMEAARALGLSHSAAMRRVILPQALRRLIPPVVNELAALAKDTSLVSVIALSEMLYMTQRLGAKYLRPWEVYFWAATGYLLVVGALSGGAHVIERRLAARD